MKKINILSGLIYFYVMLPITLFFLGWTKWYIALAGVGILGLCWYRMSCDTRPVELPELDAEKIEKLVFVILIIAFWVYLSGIGKFVFQNTDHDCRNPIFEILVNYSWPPTRTVMTEAGLETKGLIYYIGFWLPAAVVGKFFGVTAGYCFQALWAVVGIFIFYLLLSSTLKEIRIWPLLVFIFFSGLDIVGMLLTNGTLEGITATTHLEWWASTFEFSSFTTQLFWVFNQSIPAWVILMLILRQKKNRYMVVLLGSMLLCSTLPFIGLIPFAAYWGFTRSYEGCAGREKVRAWVKDTFSVENILGGGISGIITWLYLMNNEAGQNIVSAGGENPGVRGYLLLYVIFILIEIGGYYLLLYRDEKRNPVYYISFIWLLICPLIRIGYGTDFGMRASIPALLILCLLCIKAIGRWWKEKRRGVLICMLILLSVGSITPLCEINRTIHMTVQSYRNKEKVYSDSQSEDDIFGSYNFSGKVDNNFFFEYIAR